MTDTPGAWSSPWPPTRQPSPLHSPGSHVAASKATACLRLSEDCKGAGGPSQAAARPWLVPTRLQAQPSPSPPRSLSQSLSLPPSFAPSDVHASTVYPSYLSLCRQPLPLPTQPTPAHRNGDVSYNDGETEVALDEQALKEQVWRGRRPPLPLALPWPVHILLALAYPSHAWASPSPHTVNLQPLSPSPSLKP